MIWPIIFFNEIYAVITDSMVPNVDLNRYWVSNYGVVFDSKNNRDIDITIDSEGYNTVSLKTTYGRKKCLVHRLVGMAFIPGDFSLQINHKDGNKDNCKDHNLEWCTPRENLMHALEMGLNYRGEDKPNAKISNHQAEVICQGIQNRKRIPEILMEAELEDNESHRRIIADIKRGRSFHFISKNYNFDELALRDRSLSEIEVRKICELFEQSPDNDYGIVLNALGYGYLKGKERKSMLSKIGSIKLRRAYTDISKDYSW